MRARQNLIRQNLTRQNLVCNFVSLRLKKTACVLAAVFFLAGTLSACGESGPPDTRTTQEKKRDEIGSIFDAFKNEDGSAKEDGGIFGTGLSFNGQRIGGGSGNGSSINENLWRAAYEVTSVLPISSASRQQGSIETDWYAPPGITHEQMRVVVFVGSGPLKPSAVKVNAFRRGFDAQGQVVQTPASERVSQELERAILRRAIVIANS